MPIRSPPSPYGCNSSDIAGLQRTCSAVGGIYNGTAIFCSLSNDSQVVRFQDTYNIGNLSYAEVFCVNGTNSQSGSNGTGSTTLQHASKSSLIGVSVLIVVSVLASISF